MKKLFILDTNVLLFDPQALFKFGKNDIIIPIVVIEEIDRFKRELSENGRHARLFSRIMDDIRLQGKLSHGVQLAHGGSIRVELGSTQPNSLVLPIDTVDNHILSIAILLQKKNPEDSVIFVTKDVNLRIKADAFGIIARDYEPSSVEPEELYSGTSTLSVVTTIFEKLQKDKFLKTSFLEIEKNFKPNEYVCLQQDNNKEKTILTRFCIEKQALILLNDLPEGLWGILPKNKEQAYAMDALLNDEIKLVSLVGKAGTGKTLLAIAAGLAKTVDEGIYHRLLVSRPVFPLGRDIGFLPGDIEEKLNPWMQPIYDNIDFLFGNSSLSGRRGSGKGCQELMNQGLLQIEPLTYIRGRSIPHQYLIIDESQNLTPHEIKTIVTRAGEETKIVITGDSYQIDNPYVDSANNGLVYLVDRFKGEKISAHITLTQGERSELSELASNLL